MERGGGSARELETGLPEMDVEHQLQLRLVEALRQAVATGRERAELAALLQQLEDASSVHFMSEELLMRLHAWERYEQHSQEHGRLLEELAALRARFEGPEVDLQAPLDQLQAWLEAHVRGMDRAFADHVRRGAPAPAPAGPAAGGR